jgi:hypothetical protein
MMFALTRDVVQRVFKVAAAARQAGSSYEADHCFSTRCAHAREILASSSLAGARSSSDWFTTGSMFETALRTSSSTSSSGFLTVLAVCSNSDV